MRTTVLALAAVLGLCPGCAEQPKDGFEAFFAATTARDSDAAWERLTLASRRALQDAAATAPTKKTAKELLFGEGGGGAGLALTTTLRRIDVLEQDDARARLKVVDALGRGEEVFMRREDGVWRLDLVASQTPQGPR